MLAIFLLGFVMDAFEIIFVVVPIVAPALLKMPGVDPVWLGIMIAVEFRDRRICIRRSADAFYLRGVAPPQITTRHIYVGDRPVRGDQLFALVVLWFLLELRPARCPGLRTCARSAKAARREPRPIRPASSSEIPTAVEPMSLT